MHQNTDQRTTTTHQLFINGEWTDAAAKGTYEKANPFNGKPASTVAAGKREDAKRAIEAAAAAFPTWSNTAPAVRRKLLLKAADVLDSRIRPTSPASPPKKPAKPSAGACSIAFSPQDFSAKPPRKPTASSAK